MKRQHRTWIVLFIAVAVAGLASFAVYRAVQRMPVRQVEVASVHMLVAARNLPMGTRLTKDDVRLVPWPSRHQVQGGFTKIDAAVNRGLIVNVSENEPLTEAKMAPVAAGAGLSPIIPAGMRAVSVKVNDVIGVAGFVVPGSRVDVLVTMKGSGDRDESMARTVVSNVQVLTAGTKYDQEKGKDGKPMPASVVTLMVAPSDAERIALATNEGKISLTLRNPLDVDPTVTNGIRTAALLGSPAPPAPVVATARRRAAAPPPPAPPVVSSVYTIETIRAAKRGEEIVR